ncbi:MAG: 5'-methylthioadenosine/S-adenosylhomocysteine nucleosidase [Clostridia bacterium]|nr:5'-methylthioadenosine/S-adenosylhomocysteine nucleosidase [Clostridia bacterium]
MKFKKIGIVVADSEEYYPLKSATEKYGAKEYKNFLSREGITFKIGTCEIVALYCGVGKVNAAAGAMHLVDIGCDAILNYGLSGGISGVKREEIIFPQTFVEHDFDMTVIGYKPCEKPMQKYIYDADTELLNKAKQVGFAVKGTAVSGDKFISCEADREFFEKTFCASSCDMETAAIAYVCDFAGVPFACLRKISDDAGEDAGTDYREINNFFGDQLIDVFLRYLTYLCEDK